MVYDRGREREREREKRNGDSMNNNIKMNKWLDVVSSMYDM